MSRSFQLCPHNVNTRHCRLCQAERKRQAEAAAEKERKRKEWEAKRPDKHASARKVLGLSS